MEYTFFKGVLKKFYLQNIKASDCWFSEKMDNFSPMDPVFIEPEVRSHFISFVNSDNLTGTNNVSETEIWKWLRTPPLETVVRCLILLHTPQCLLY